jgi:hypothetical protein
MTQDEVKKWSCTDRQLGILFSWRTLAALLLLLLLLQVWSQVPADSGRYTAGDLRVHCGSTYRIFAWNQRHWHD